MIEALIGGKLIRDPVIKTGASGKPFCNFLLSVAVAETELIIVSGIAFGEVAERIGRLGKGDALSVAGALKPTTWNDKATGEQRHGLTVTVSAALSPYDVKKRRPAADAASGEPTRVSWRRQRPGQDHRQLYGPGDFNDPINF